MKKPAFITRLDCIRPALYVLYLQMKAATTELFSSRSCLNDAACQFGCVILLRCVTLPLVPIWEREAVYMWHHDDEKLWLPSTCNWLWTISDDFKCLKCNLPRDIHEMVCPMKNMCSSLAQHVCMHASVAVYNSALGSCTSLLRPYKTDRGLGITNR